MSQEHLAIIVTVIGSMFASTGFWTYIQNKHSYKSAQNRMLLGLAHDKIVELGMLYVDRGFITQTEHENLFKYLFLPYTEMKGNGHIERLMTEVNTLPIKIIHEFKHGGTDEKTQ